MSTQTKQDDGTRDFHEQLKTILPRLRIYALSLTRDRDAADDLVHDTVIEPCFRPGDDNLKIVFREAKIGIKRIQHLGGVSDGHKHFWHGSSPN